MTHNQVLSLVGTALVVAGGAHETARWSEGVTNSGVAFMAGAALLLLALMNVAMDRTKAARAAR